jgi:hypothetical protein
MSKSRYWAKKNLMLGINTTNCICEKLREIYDCVYELPDGKIKDSLTDHLVDAFIMAKKMSARLGYYKTTYNDTTGSGGRNLLPMPKCSIKVKLRAKRI